ncbi:putative ribonuclease H-like domain-containing protein, partial [Tanacetum coccineum]
SATRTPNVVNAGLESFPTLSETHEIHSPASANEKNMNDAGTTVGPTPAGNTLGMSSYANVTGEPSRKNFNFCTLFTPSGNEVDVVVPVEFIRAISERFANTAYDFFLGKRVAYPVVANYIRITCGKYGLVKSMLNSSTGIFSFQFSSMDGLDAMLENAPWFIRNNPLIMKKWNPDDGSSVIATKLGTHLMLDSYTSDMCIQSWGRSSCDRALIEAQADVELKDNIVVAMPKLVEEGFYTCTVRVKYEWKPPRAVLVGPKVGFKPVKQVYIHVSKKNNVNTNDDKKKDVKPTIEVSNSNPFDVLNSAENDIDLGTNGGTSELASKKANSNGSSFWNVESSSTSTTLIVEKINKIKRLIIDGKVTFVDNEGKPLTKVDYSNDHDSEDEVASVDNEMTNFLASKKAGYGQDIPDKIQSICDNLDIKVRGRKKK